MPSFYNIQCLNGHSWRVATDSPLGQRAMAREQKGFLDALPVPCDQCDECNEGWGSYSGMEDELQDERWFNNHPEDMLPSPTDEI